MVTWTKLGQGLSSIDEWEKKAKTMTELHTKSNRSRDLVRRSARLVTYHRLLALMKNIVANFAADWH